MPSSLGRSGFQLASLTKLVLDAEVYGIVGTCPPSSDAVPNCAQGSVISANHVHRESEVMLRTTGPSDR